MIMDIHHILKQLPHRYPILLVDRVLELESGKRIKALKNVSINEPLPPPSSDAWGVDLGSLGASGSAAEF